MTDNTIALYALLCVPCASCGCPYDERVWVGRFVEGVFVNLCPDCYERENSSADVDVREYAREVRIRAIRQSQLRLWG